MRLGQLLGDLTPERIEKLCLDLVPGGGELELHQRASSVESLLRDSGFIEQVLFEHKPPVLALLRELLEARDYRASVEALRQTVMNTTEHWCYRVNAGELAARADTFRIYQRVLAAAWSNDLVIDASERSLLTVLRREVGMSTVEHFLISHHAEIQPFWRRPDAYDAEVRALVDHGILFQVGDDLVLPNEFVTRVRRALGLQISRGAAIRLLDWLSNEDLRVALDRYGMKKGGDKADRLARLIDDMVPISDVLDVVGVGELQDLAREMGSSSAGSKAELINRLVAHFESGTDIKIRREADADVPTEAKVLVERAFHQLFSPLTGHQLELVCRRLELRHSGSKEARIAGMWTSPYCEHTLLRALKNSDLSDLCRGHELDGSGTKEVMIERLVRGIERAVPAIDESMT